MRHTSRTNIVVCVVLWLLLVHIIRSSVLCRPLGLSWDRDVDDDNKNDHRKSSSSSPPSYEYQHVQDHGRDHGRGNSKGNAYVFYATSNLYACSAMVNVDRLTRVFRTPHPIYILVSRGVSEKYTRTFRDVYNVTVLVHEPPRLHDGAAPYYQDVMLKLLAFGLNNLTSTTPSTTSRVDPGPGPAGGRVERAIVMDADVLVLRSLDNLFGLVGGDFDADAGVVDVAAPHAYWLEQGQHRQQQHRQQEQQQQQQQQQHKQQHQQTNAMDGGRGTKRKGVTSAVMVLRLSDVLWERTENALDRVRRGDRVEVYDMDLINEEFFGAGLGGAGDDGGGGGGGGTVLPGAYCTLNSHWEVQEVPAWSRFSDEGYSRPPLKKTENSSSGGGGGGGVGNADRTHRSNSTTITAASDGAAAGTADGRGLVEDPLTSLFYGEAHILHFTALGKPWSVTVQSVHQARPEAHPLFAEQFLLWRRAAKYVCPALGVGETGWNEIVGKRYTHPGEAVAEGDGSAGPDVAASPVTDRFLDDI
ncbi:hypothetical protein PV08_10211 [Exophiala spinifera]|uniref:Uncharacterized protein n=1 Tax=Exophiala spinifera TaxID=91928 RepID=A0A0D1ZD45_9EURO|nr:uncharacterized protein PV08_10211 [Exophiala spinifera]KIW10912.1 hypothetical protein PV08_10211 [Exophiala spinifera]